MSTLTAEITTPRIYVACFAAYNNGYLHGAWIDATQGEWGIWDDIQKMLAASPIPEAEEHAIQIAVIVSGKASNINAGFGGQGCGAGHVFLTWWLGSGCV